MKGYLNWDRGGGRPEQEAWGRGCGGLQAGGQSLDRRDWGPAHLSSSGKPT